jgi:uncharacterized SAM-binding protein YcdF (DUF218 family)
MVRPLRQIVHGQHVHYSHQLWLYMLLVVVLMTMLLIGRDVLGIWSYTRALVTPCQTETILVMGAAQYDGRPSPAFKRRLDKAFDLYEQGCASTIVVSGGKRKGDRFSEGEAGVKYLASRGISANALQSETQSTSSYQNLLLSKPLITTHNLTIVTDDLHAYRTQYLAKALGYEPSLATVFNPYKRVSYAARELLMLIAFHLGIVR